MGGMANPRDAAARNGARLRRNMTAVNYHHLAHLPAVNSNMLNLLPLLLAATTAAVDRVVDRHTLRFTSYPLRTPTVNNPDGPLAANGDLGVSVGHSHTDNGGLGLYLGKNDFWGWPGPVIYHASFEHYTPGAVRLTVPAWGNLTRFEGTQCMRNGTVTASVHEKPSTGGERAGGLSLAGAGCASADQLRDLMNMSQIFESAEDDKTTTANPTSSSAPPNTNSDADVGFDPGELVPLLEPEATAADLEAAWAGMKSGSVSEAEAVDVMERLMRTREAVLRAELRDELSGDARCGRMRQGGTQQVARARDPFSLTRVHHRSRSHSPSARPGQVLLDGGYLLSTADAEIEVQSHRAHKGNHGHQATEQGAVLVGLIVLGRGYLS